ncbi:IclR family transcriptional regulator [Chelatococcus asaccharovorans]|uniref:IclR family transcriptional regulator n=1 Tax=Chelatococcus asaccharovorans TaxID=28210 RepID=A0A2V3TXA4_9HYPH|nr:helix-turn-helix domain-containing protein [Chelatococcus asaccharovorans]MBS7706844.1 helix-turn-helix domain-containing protein [Chelatococcus asaccharovorans]PXW54010.1 IclR family transcriptional regulator [Chelatococcus asaccharovorans]
MSSLDNALRILSLLNAQNPVLRVGEVARQIDLPKTSVSRLLKAMGESGLLERESDGLGYIAGPRGLVLGELYLAQHGLVTTMERVSDKLTGEFGFVGYISKLDKDELFILRRKYGSYPLRLIRDVGQRAPAFQTASGRALLAQLPEDQALAIVATDPVWRERSEMVPGILAAIRERGVSLAVSTGTPGVAAIAAAVSDAGGSDILAFSISYPIAATDEAMRLTMAMRVWGEALALGRSYGDPLWIGRSAGRPDFSRAVRLGDAPSGEIAFLAGAE